MAQTTSPSTITTTTINGTPVTTGITMANTNGTYTIPSNGVITTSNSTYNITGTAQKATIGTNNGSGYITLDGDEADIEINGVKLSDTLKEIQDRLCIMVPNTKLEADWSDLRKAGEEYRRLEAKVIERAKIIDILSQD